jgi:voltage-gated potassium channel
MPAAKKIKPPQTYSKEGLVKTVYEIIFEASTGPGKSFDLALLGLILTSVLLVSLESVSGFREAYVDQLVVLEWIITAFFTIEYLFRIWCVKYKLRYITSFFGIIDLISILPAFVGLWISGTHSLIVIRAFRLLRIFRILKLSQYLGEAQVLKNAMKASSPKIIVFLGTILIMVMIMGSVMHLVEGPENGFTSIPKGMYWAIVTMTTVGYGDISPQTPLGQALASMLMISGYGIIAVPTGVVTAEITAMTQQKPAVKVLQSCDHCNTSFVEEEDLFCRRCGKNITNS